MGTLRGYDAFLNVVLEEAMPAEAAGSSDGEGGQGLGTVVIRGNSIIQFESIERVAK